MEITKSKRTKSKDRLKANGSISTRTISLFLNRETEIEEIHPLTQGRELSPPLSELLHGLNKQIHGLSEHIKILATSLQNELVQSSSAQTISVPSKSGYTVLRLTELLCLKADGCYTCFYLKDGRRLTSSKPIGFYRNLLNSANFYSTNRSWIVNLSEVVGFQSDVNKIIMADGQLIRVSKEIVPRLKSVLQCE